MKKCSYCGKEYPDETLACPVDGQPLQPAMAPPQMSPPLAGGQYYGTRKLLAYIAPLRAGVVLAVLYAFFGLIFIPFFLVAALFSKQGGGPAALGGLFFSFLFPVLYAIAGFIGGVIAAAIYNLVAKWTGGLEFELRDAPPPAF